jgi:ATP phosphoribosyltransferase
LLFLKVRFCRFSQVFFWFNTNTFVEGRLYEKCTQLLSGADIQYKRSNRLDIALSTNLPIALIFLPAGDIPVFVGEGQCDIGITGLDQVQEANMYDSIDDLLDLKFGACKLQIQVPEGGEFDQPNQLIGKKIVTSFTKLTKEYFQKLEGTKDICTTIRYVGGSVEASVALGVGDAIVDLVESGETMRAAGLKPIETILSTSAHLIASKKSKRPELIQKVLQRLEGVMAANKYVYITYNASRSILKQVLKITPGRKAATISALESTNHGDADEETDWIAVNAMVEKSQIGNIMDDLKNVGATDIIVFEISNCRV